MIDDDPCLGYRMFWARLRGIGIAKTVKSQVCCKFGSVIVTD
jgi:hypothetical protein